jgi:RHS repeat-associated protein
LGDVYQGSLKNNYLYQGANSELDDDIGWHDFMLRNYDAQTGRWVQQDPYQQFASPYVGMGNDPINNTDPSGGIVIDPIKTLETVVVTATRAKPVAQAASFISTLSNVSKFVGWAAKVSGAINTSINTVQAGSQGVGGGGGPNASAYQESNTDKVGTYGKMNFVITSKTQWDKQWALKATVIQARLALNWKIIYATNAKDAYEQIEKFCEGNTCYDQDIGNVIVDSHGGYKKASFSVGDQEFNSITAGTNKYLKMIGEKMNASSQVLLLACHVGGTHNEGKTLLKNLALNMNVQVYGSQSWTSPRPLMFMGANLAYKDTDWINSDGTENPARKYAFRNYGNWSTGIPFGGGHASDVDVSRYIGIKNGEIRTFKK